MSHRFERVNLCEHYSTVWVNFCLLESAMLWRICALSLCKCRSVVEEEQRASRSTISRLMISLMLGINLTEKDVTLGDVVFCGTV